MEENKKPFIKVNMAAIEVMLDTLKASLRMTDENWLHAGNYSASVRQSVVNHVLASLNGEYAEIESEPQEKKEEIKPEDGKPKE